MTAETNSRPKGVQMPHSIRLRLSDVQKSQLDYCAQIEGVNASTVLRMALSEHYKAVKKAEKAEK